MFFIAGITPKLKQLDESSGLCPICRSRPAYYKRVDHYLTLFFIPILRIKTGEPFLMCDHCAESAHEFEDIRPYLQGKNELTCPYCNKTIKESFQYCPHCGNALSNKQT